MRDFFLLSASRYIRAVHTCMNDGPAGPPKCLRRVRTGQSRARRARRRPVPPVQPGPWQKLEKECEWRRKRRRLFCYYSIRGSLSSRTPFILATFSVLFFCTFCSGLIWQKKASSFLGRALYGCHKVDLFTKRQSYGWIKTTARACVAAPTCLRLTRCSPPSC